MNYSGSSFTYKKAILHYTKYGSGTKVLLAFHGFRQTGLYFQPIALNFPEQYTLYAFDLFFHGKSHWPLKDTAISKQHWAEMIGAFLTENQIYQFSLMGFSIGAKFVLATLESFPERVAELILIAPDGIKENIWYSLATSPALTRIYFRKMVISPQVFIHFATASLKMGFLNKKMLRFANSQMDSREKRLKLYYTWMLCRKLKFNNQLIANIINTHHIPIIFFLGTYDQIITERILQSLLKKINNYQLVLLTCSHSRLLEEVAKYYGKLNGEA